MFSRGELNSVTSTILRGAFEVHSALGPGLLETTYEKCLAFKLEKLGLIVRKQVYVPLQFEELLIHDAFRIDLLVNDAVVVELKACEVLNAIHFAQVLSYLKALNVRVGLLMNFNSLHLKDGIHRVVNNF